MRRGTDDLWRLTLADVSAITQWPYDEVLGHTTIINARVTRKVAPLAKQRVMLTRLKKLHEIMGHPPVEVMWRAIKYKHWTNSGIPSEEVRRLWAKLNCISCVMAKSNKIPKSIASDPRTTVPGQVISGDPFPVNIPGVGGDTWIFLFKDICTQYWHGAISTTKNNFVEILELILSWYVKQGRKPETFRSDDEVLLRDTRMMALLDKYGMNKQSSAPYQHYQNSVERDIQTCIKAISCQLHDQPLLPAKWWDHIFWHLIEVHNRVPNKSTVNETPRSIMMKNENEKVTNVSNTFNFKIGELVGVGIAKEHRTWKFDTKRELGIYVGQPEGQVDSHLIYFPYTDNILSRADVIPLDIPKEDLAKFYLTRAGMKSSMPVYSRVVEMAQGLGISSDLPKVEVTKSPMQKDVPLPEKMATRGNPARIRNAKAGLKEETINDQDVQDPEKNLLFEKFEEYVNSRITHDTMFCSTDFFKNDEEMPSRQFSSDNGENKFYEVNAARVHNAENPTMAKACESEQEGEFWKGAIRSEVFKNLLNPGKESLQAQDFALLPKEVLITYLTFVLKKKVKPEREDVYKARGCFRGDLLSSAGYAETYSPTVSSVTCASLQQIALIDEMEQQLVDTVAAFLGQDYLESAPPLYVKFDKRVARICGLDPNVVYRVVKYLYGIPDAGRAYYLAYSGHLLNLGYKKCKMDPCLFYKLSELGPIYAWIHVDDTWVAAATKALMKQFVSDVEVKFQVTVEPIDNYLGVHYTKLDDGSWRKTQPKLLNDLFKRTDMKSKAYVKTPCATPSDAPRDMTLFNVTKYLSLIGVLLYLNFSRPDIAFAVSYGATKSAAPTVSDHKDLLRVVQYLYQTREKGLIIRKQPKGCPLQMHIYVDASYLLYPDSKGQTGFCFSLNDEGIFYAKSVKQSVVTTSSTHSEMRALFVAVCEYLFLEQLFAEIGRPLVSPAIVNEDNQPVVTLLTRESAMPKQSKHFVMLVHYVREQMLEGKLDIRKIATWENTSDLFTKGVYGRDYGYKCQKLLGRQSGEPIILPVVPTGREE